MMQQKHYRAGLLAKLHAAPLPAKSPPDKRMGLIFGHNADIV